MTMHSLETLGAQSSIPAPAQAPPVRHSLPLHGLKRWASRAGVALAVPVCLLLLWHVAALQGWVSELILPAPLVVAQTFQSLIESGEIPAHFAVSIGRVIQGFLIGGAAGLLLGVALGLSRTFHDYAGPLFKLLSNVPKIGWLPLLMIALGIEESLKITIIALSSLIPVTINTLEGIRNVPSSYIEVARMARFNYWQLLVKVIFPAAMPEIFAGMRIAAGISWKILVVVEMLASSNGLGYLLTTGRFAFQMDTMLSAVVVIGFAGLLIDQSFKRLEAYLLRWRKAGFGQ
jgi:sulfonate transport system permease protein